MQKVTSIDLNGNAYELDESGDEPLRPGYCCRSAMSGSVRDARRAGQ